MNKKRITVSILLILIITWAILYFMKPANKIACKIIGAKYNECPPPCGSGTDVCITSCGEPKCEYK